MTAQSIRPLRSEDQEAIARFVVRVAKRFGAPATISVSRSPHAIAKSRTALIAATRPQRLAEIKRLIAAAGFVPKDFFLTQPPTPDKNDEAAYGRWLARERRRRPIARLLYRCGFTAHDLAPENPELRTVDGADGEKERMSAEEEHIMCADMTKYGSASYLGVDDVREGPIRGVIAAVEVNKKIDRPTLIFTNGLKFTLNKTNAQTLLNDVGTDDESWRGETVESHFRSNRIQGEDGGHGGVERDPARTGRREESPAETEDCHQTARRYERRNTF
jgi:hypothetical protein